MGIHVPKGEGTASGIFLHLRPHWFDWEEWHIFCREMYSTHKQKVDSISVRTSYCWNLRFIGFLKSSSRSMLGFAQNLQKCNAYFRHRSSIAARHAAGVNRYYEIKYPV